MLVKFIVCTVFCFCTCYFGIEYVRLAKEKIQMISDYIFFANSLKSAVIYSGENVFEFFEKIKNSAREFCEFAKTNKNNGILWAIDNYKARNVQEKECLRILRQSLITTELSSDVLGIGNTLEQAVMELEELKKQTQEDYKGKIKIAPSLGLLCGLFAVILFI